MRELKVVMKLIVVGDSGAGKSTLITRFELGKFNETLETTHGSAFLEKKVQLDNRDCTLNIWDTAGQERYKAFTQIFFNGAHGAMLVFDASDFDNAYTKLSAWVNYLKEVVCSTIPFLLVAAKSDCYKGENLKNDTECLMEFLNLRRKVFFSGFAITSAKTGEGVEEAFKTLAKSVLLNNEKIVQSGAGDLFGNKHSSKVRLDKPTNNKSRCCN